MNYRLTQRVMWGAALLLLQGFGVSACETDGSPSSTVTVLDTCGDDDCDGCCTQNKGNADELIDLESYTNTRFGIEDGRIQWADLGPTQADGCK
jgi:hypothetical protein